MLKFNDWSRERILEGRKFCATRHNDYGDDPCVDLVQEHPLDIVKYFFFRDEGCASPEEFEEVWTSIFGEYEPEKNVFVHFINKKVLMEKFRKIVCDYNESEWTQKDSQRTEEYEEAMKWL